MRNFIKIVRRTLSDVLLVFAAIVGGEDPEGIENELEGMEDTLG